MKKITEKYAKFVGNNPWKVLIFSLIFSLVMFIGLQFMETADSDYEDMLPEDYEVIEAFNIISEEFGSSLSGSVVLEVDNSFANSNEYDSVLSSEVVRYSLLLENYFSRLEGVESVNGFGQLVEEKHGFIVNDFNLLKKDYFEFGTNYISEDESMAIIRIIFDEEVDTEIITQEFSDLIDRIDSPAGIKVSLAGEVFEGVLVQAQLIPDMSRTSMFSLIAIVLILTLIFRSFKGVVMPLATILLGVLWTMGFLGLVGGGISSMTSGAISMIMGIGIDFGIQLMNRYDLELKGHKKQIAMNRALLGILNPILTTALACLIGFQAMSLGELSMMSELGNIMSLGVVFCMFAAITFLPSALVLLTLSKKKE